MLQTINSNIASLTAQRNLNTSQSSLNTSLERLSSGLRINSAKDDAAGLAISERFTSQIRGLNQAARNANDGISLAQTAEGALSEVGNNLQRIRELSVQSANATNSASDRAALQAEVTQLTAEITRVAEQTQFNGTDLLDGSFTSQRFQVGANANQTIDIAQIGDARASALGNNVLDTSDVAATVAGTAVADAAANGLVADNTVVLTTNLGSTTAGDIDIAGDASASDIAAQINSAASDIGVKATASTTATVSNVSATGALTFDLGDGTDSTAINVNIVDTNDLSSLAAAINDKQNITGVTASFATSDKSSLTLTDSAGKNIAVTNNSVATAFNIAGEAGGAGITPAAAGGVAIVTGNVELSSLAGAVGVTGNTNADIFAVGNTVSTLNEVSGLDITTASGAQSAIDSLDAALDQVNSARGDLGAIQNRFSSTITNLQTTAENLSASRSRIQDTDFAAETANLTRGQILQQAGVAILAQANSLPNNVLSLLR